VRGLTPDLVADAAIRIADADGLEAVTIARLAAELGVRPPSLYNHIESRDALLRTVATRAVDELAQRLAGAAVGRSGPDAVTAVAHAYRDFAREHPGWYAATQRPDQDPEAGRRAVDVVLASLRAWDLDETDALHTVRILRAALHGFAALEASGGFGAPIDVDESFDRLVKTLIAGL
jgi:AcrR family transcriptional regulator